MMFVAENVYGCKDRFFSNIMATFMPKTLFFSLKMYSRWLLLLLCGGVFILFEEMSRNNDKKLRE